MFTLPVDPEIQRLSSNLMAIKTISNNCSRKIQFILFLKTAMNNDILNFLQHSSFLASSNFCHLLISFANSLDPDQDQHL